MDVIIKFHKLQNVCTIMEMASCCSFYNMDTQQPLTIISIDVTFLL
jgi:hypothetical protein